MIRDNEFCVIENGVQVEAWSALPGDANTFRIYKRFPTTLYTASTGSKTPYETDEWKIETAPRWFGDDNDSNASEYTNEDEEFFNGIYTKGERLRLSTSYDTPPTYSDALFSRAANDPYGENGGGEVYGSYKLPLIGSIAETAPFGARLPALRMRLSDGALDNIVFAVLPLFNSALSNLADNRILARLPLLASSSSDIGILEEPKINSVNATLPFLLASSQASNYKPNKIPALKTKITGVHSSKAVLPALHSRLGDPLNMVYAKLPMLVSSSVGEMTTPQIAFGQVIIPMGIVIQLNGQNGDEPLGGIDTPPMETRALVCFADGDISVFSAMEMATAEMTGYLGGEVGIIRYAELKTVSMVGVLGGSIDAEAVSTLQAVPMFMLLGGSIGGEASSPQDVVQWAGVSEFDAANEVFCASIEDGGVGGTTRYRAYAFNSFATIDGKHYGANAGGLFLLDGNADGAEKINSEFGFGQLDFGKPNMKNISYCYIGARAGAMRLGIDSLVDGKPTRGNYASRAHGGSTREVRFDLGRGLRSTYVIPTFYNNNGEDFEVDNIRFLLAESTRRI